MKRAKDELEEEEEEDSSSSNRRRNNIMKMLSDHEVARPHEQIKEVNHHCGGRGEVEAEEHEEGEEEEEEDAFNVLPNVRYPFASSKSSRAGCLQECLPPVASNLGTTGPFFV